jgi:hypothetical protein
MPMTQRDSGFYIQIGCGFFILLAIFTAAFLLVFAKIQANHFWGDGVRVEGVVVAVDAQTFPQSVSASKKKIIGENVQFEYLVDGQPFYHRQHFSYDTSFIVGQKVPVIYLSNHPWTAEIQNTSVEDHSLLFLIFGPLTAIVIGALMIRRDPRKKQKRKPHEESLSL